MVQESKSDRRDVPRYTPQEAAHHLSMPPATVRAWSVGYRYGASGKEARRFQPLITLATRSPLALSFWNLVELYVLASLRRRYEVPMPKVRSALRYTARELGAQRPLIEETFYTDGIDIFVEKFSTLIDARSRARSRSTPSVRSGASSSLARVSRRKSSPNAFERVRRSTR